MARDPEKDFTRRRKLWPERLVKILLTMGGGDLNSELLEYFNYSADAASVSAFSQQRVKLRPEVLERLFRAFRFKPGKLFRGYRLLATDGSDMQIPMKERNRYRFIPKTLRFDLLDPESDDFYHLPFRTDREAVHVEGRKHAYRENFANAANVCRRFFRGLVKAEAVELLLKRQQTPERPGRSSPRKLNPKEPVSFNYRMA